MACIRFQVFGRPAPAGSKRGFPIRRKNGQIGVAMSDDSKRSKPWQAAISAEGVQVMNGNALLEGPLAVTFLFNQARPRGHYGKRGLRPSAPTHPTTRPDVLKLARAAEDALTGIVWRDDAQIVDEAIMKVYGEPEGIVIEVRTL